MMSYGAASQPGSPHRADQLKHLSDKTFRTLWTTRDQVLAFLGISAVDRFVVPQLILIDREGMIHYQTPPLGDEESYKEDVIRSRVEALLAMPSGRRSTASHNTAARKR